MNPRIETYNYYHDSRVQEGMFSSIWSIAHQGAGEAVVVFDEEWIESIVFELTISKIVDGWIEQKAECTERYIALSDEVKVKSDRHRSLKEWARSNGCRWSKDISDSYQDLRKSEAALHDERNKLNDFALAGNPLEVEIKNLNFINYENGEGVHLYCLRLTTEFEVCGECRGCGSVVNPSIDCCGLTQDDFYDDPDFAEDYFSGRHGIICPRCRGIRVEATPRFPEWLKVKIDQHDEDQWDMIREQCAELAMGA